MVDSKAKEYSEGTKKLSLITTSPFMLYFVMVSKSFSSLCAHSNILSLNVISSKITGTIILPLQYTPFFIK